jgi:hypothetical protein
VIAGLAVVLLAAIFLWIYCSEIRGLLNRLATHPPQSVDQSLPNPQADNSQHSLPTLGVTPDSLAAAEHAEELLGVIKSSNHPAEKKLELTAIHLSNCILRHEYEVLFRKIYGSQLEALQALRQEGPQPLAKFYESFLERIEKHFSANYPSGIRPDFETWAGFLANSIYPYVNIEGGIARITSRGEGFLSYLSQNGLNYPRIW